MGELSHDIEQCLCDCACDGRRADQARCSCEEAAFVRPSACCWENALAYLMRYMRASAASTPSITCSIALRTR